MKVWSPKGWKITRRGSVSNGSSPSSLIEEMTVCTDPLVEGHEEDQASLGEDVEDHEEDPGEQQLGSVGPAGGHQDGGKAV